MNTKKKSLEQQLPYFLFPLILAVNVSALVFAVHYQWDLGNAFSTQLIGNLVGMFLLEKALRFKKEWDMSFFEFLRDFGYFGFNGIIDTAVKLSLGYLAINYASPTASLPLWISAPLAILIVEFFGYWYHRLGHEHHWLWKIHSIHHVPDKVNLLNNNTANFLNIAFGGTVKLLPLILLGFGQEAVFIAASLTTIHSYIVHVNADLRGGWLAHLFFTPEHHRLHHSTDIQEAKNFAVLLTFWDRVFGTYVYKGQEVPEVIGVSHPEEYPKPFQVVKGFLFPFTRKRLW